MILVDTSVWVDHLRVPVARLVSLLQRTEVLIHPFVVGELAVGNLRNRQRILADLRELPTASVATDAEVLAFIDRAGLHGRGIGYVDAHLLAATMLTGSAALWTFDRRLAEVATELRLAG
jgi:predicted nucleic acid-binding protein